MQVCGTGPVVELLRGMRPQVQSQFHASSFKTTEILAYKYLVSDSVTKFEEAVQLWGENNLKRKQGIFSGDHYIVFYNI